MFLRSFAVQGSWNYRTLVGAGLAFSLLPALRAVYGRRGERLDEAVRRHAGVFNSHPYLSPMAIGAIARLEADGEDAAVVERFKSAIRGSLGTLGDRLVWAGWRPVCLLFTLALLLVGVPWWAGVVGFLLAYNTGHLLLRVWSYRLGLERGKGVAEQLRQSAVPRLQRLLTVAGAFLAGVVLPLVASGRLVGLRLELPWALAAALVAFLGARYGAVVRRPIVIGLVGFALVGLFLQIVR
ncbi:MAG: PTS system mannose/fructose/sorbose family transporter subunit IID [Gemmatimonadetes bacterium]|nr:PTS system mannose/fructose/sorbose family transporter subunit IID [Gemmatimonadota bacterium]